MGDLVTACQQGDLESVQRLLKANDDPQKVETGLWRAINAKQVDVVKFLMNHGAKITHSAFISAAGAKSIEIWSCFLDHGWDINSVQYYDTILRLSTTNISLVKWLLERGADVNKAGPWRHGHRGVPPLQAALANNEVPTMRILVENGAIIENVVIEQCLGLDALWINDECLQFLLEAGLNPNFHVERWVCTPLQQAVRRGLLEKARMLVEAGANPNVRDRDRKTPLDQARENGNQAMIELLESACLKMPAPYNLRPRWQGAASVETTTANAPRVKAIKANNTRAKTTKAKTTTLKKSRAKVTKR